MTSSKNFFLICVVGLLCFTVDLDATATTILSELTNTEKLLASKSFQEMEESIIMHNSDRDSIAAKAAIEGIRKEALRLKDAGDLEKLLLPIIDSILGGVRIFSLTQRKMYNAFDEALNLTMVDPRTAVRIVQDTMQSVPELIYSIGVPMEEAFGSALAKTGGSNHNELKLCLSFLQRSGIVLLENLKIGGEIAILGIEAGGKAAEVAMRAARAAVHTGELSGLKFISEGVKNFIDSSLNSATSSNIYTDANRVQCIIDNLRTNVTVTNPAALAAIESLYSHKTSLIGIVSQPALDVANVVVVALNSAIAEGANAIALATNAFKRAKDLFSLDKQAAINAVQQGIQQAKDELVHSASHAFLSFGAAKEVSNGIFSSDTLIGAMVELVMGRVSAYNILKLSEDSVLIGIQSGNIDQGVLAGTEICEAAGNVLYTQFLDSGMIALKVLQSIQSK